MYLYREDTGTADHINIYNGSTLVGTIGAEDSTWLRLNQEVAKNIYTPRYIRADGGFYVGSSNTVWHRGDLRGGSATVAVYSWGYGTISHGLGTTPDFAFVGARTRLSSDNDNQLAFPVTAASSSTITFRAYEINGNGNSNYTSSTIYSATVYVYWLAGDT